MTFKHANTQTPLMQQYLQIKSEHNDSNTILFFRLGDFYEMFFEDAVDAARILDITLTSRNRNDPNPVPLCGVPYHAAEAYIARLIQAGRKVAICEQVEDPKSSKGVVRREVVRLVTPGAVLTADSLPARAHNFLASVFERNNRYGLALIDISTGDFRLTELASAKALTDELERWEPRELLICAGESSSNAKETSANKNNNNNKFSGGPNCVVTELAKQEFDEKLLPPNLIQDSNVHECSSAAMPAAAAVWQYLKHVKLAGPALEKHIEKITTYQPTDYLVIDEVTKRNLEMTRTMVDGAQYGSLFWLIDKTATAMGSRALKQWMFYPLRSIGGINSRLDAIELLSNNVPIQQQLQNSLKQVADMERIVGRVLTMQANARDIGSLRDSLNVLPDARKSLQICDGLLGDLREQIDPCVDLVEKISKTLTDEPPLSLKEGGLIRDGVNKELDELRTIQREGKQFIARLESKEREQTGINTLKIRFNRVFGYYIEVTHAHTSKIPANYVRKQTLTNAERYITDELKQYEEKVMTAGERIMAIEYEEFIILREAVAKDSSRIKRSSAALAKIDALLALCLLSGEGNYCRPQIVEESIINIEQGRHPVIEKILVKDRFVPNDCKMNSDSNFLLITGPNMAGKSTVMRQVGLITLLAHMGSYVPAQSAQIGLTDRIFTRVGASDNLARGQSTFMVEMAEASTIVREATEQSLVLIDELGRGTSTFDGISIAWAVAEYLHDKVGARSLFATHYHELAELSATHPRITNFTMAIKEWNNEIIFLRSLQPGAANRSYGIAVAALAGLPEEIITRANQVLADLESEDQRMVHNEKPNQKNAKAEHAQQLGLFAGASSKSDEVAMGIRSEIAAIDCNLLTPLDALKILADLSAKAKN